MKEKNHQTVSEKKILKILISQPRLSKNKIMSLAKIPRERYADSLDALVKDQYLSLQNERYEITERGISYFDEMAKINEVDKREDSLPGDNCITWLSYPC